MATAAEEQRAVLLRGDDNVAVAARPIPQGYVLEVGGRQVEVREPIALGHKVALTAIEPGEPVRKYGQVIGFASRAIPEGAWVHVHNVKADLFERDYAFATERPPVPRCAAPDVPRLPSARRPGRHPQLCRGHQHRQLLGEHVAVRSPTGSGTTSWRRDFPNVDGVFAITHKGGCAIPFRADPTTGSSSRCSPGSPTIPTSRRT